MCDCNKEEITVLIVEDHPVVRDGLAGYINAIPNMSVVGQTGDGPEAVSLAIDLVPDVVIMDVVLKGSELDGPETTRRVRSTCPNTQVLALSAFDEEDKVLPMIKAGAMGYLLKTSPADRIVQAIRQVAFRQPYLDTAIYRRLADYLVLTTGAQPDGEPRPNLTPREQEVLPLLAAGRTNSEIAEQLVISIKTVKSHVSNIFQKLHLTDRTQVGYYWALHGRAPNQDKTLPPSTDR